MSHFLLKKIKSSHLFLFFLTTFVWHLTIYYFQSMKDMTGQQDGRIIQLENSSASFYNLVDGHNLDKANKNEFEMINSSLFGTIRQIILCQTNKKMMFFEID